MTLEKFHGDETGSRTGPRTRTACMVMRAVVRSGDGEQLHEKISIAWVGGVTIQLWVAR